MLQWNVKSSSMQFAIYLLHIQWANRFVFRGQLMKFQWNESFTFFLHLGLHLSPHRFSIPLDSCMITAPVTTLSSFLTSAPSSNTRPRWLFSFWILVDIVSLDPSMGSRAMIRAEELWTIFVLLSNSLQIAGGSGRGKRWVSPFLKFTWTCVCKKREGEGPH